MVFVITLVAVVGFPWEGEAPAEPEHEDDREDDAQHRQRFVDVVSLGAVEVAGRSVPGSGT